ncbi:NADP-dependent oxidoreductase [Mammaliicoccus stepanovicii]|uniref:Alcohol dehydrogenase n=1 Tax=Mammaliicoccus stepanovicii TaxID=643214 RepID=A0A239YX88_9STAP|nr:NADP-dependent oxidoreductase [Mammaliicoccus stepanovicii]PNZ75353.1 oxidoreductase [Mammaliicoccus stepanovicii]GGI40587.1 oxidoreductase [Mammaliicoccus stepanovicii]SNV63193.1 alcohol dehydrogenase [Mammaliicoccus stepanovicii]
MRAVQLEKYNKNLEVHVNNIDVPEIKSSEVLVKVSYAAINPLEKLIISGDVKLIQDYKMPVTLGNELTGIITEIGSKVTDYYVGDKIYTRLPIDKIGAFADYIAIDTNAIAKLPVNLNLKTGAAVPLTGLTAYQAITEELQAEFGKTLFIPGGSGSFGQMAVPIAKSLGLKVIVSGSPRVKDQFIAKGVDQYIDYKSENYWEMLSNIDYVIDTLGPKEFDKELSVMKPGGTIVSLINAPNKHFAEKRGFSAFKKMLFGVAGKKFDKKAKQKSIDYRFIFVRSDGEQLKDLGEIIERDNIIPDVDDQVFTIREINKALDYTFNHHTNGKVLIKVDETQGIF